MQVFTGKTGIKQTFFAEKEVIEVFHAKVALSLLIEVLLFESVLIIASLEHYWPALETIESLVLLTKVAGKLYYLIFFTQGTAQDIILFSTDVIQDVIFIAFHQNRPLFVSRYLYKVFITSLAESSMAFLIVIILSEDFTAFHASKMTLFLHQRSIALQTYLFLFVIKGTGMIWINIHDLAVNTVTFFTILTIFWAFLLSFAELTARNRILQVDIDQGMSARTLSINVSYDLLRSRLIKVLRQVGITGLAYTKIAMMIIIDSIIADGRANATNITYVVEIRYPLEIKLMANRTSFFRTRRDSTINAVIFLADPAKRTAQFHLLALTARQVDHFLIGTNKELQLMVVEAFIFFFHFFDMQLLRRHELTLFIMFLEMFDRGKFGRAQASIIWTVELQLELGHWGNQEG